MPEMPVFEDMLAMAANNNLYAWLVPGAFIIGGLISGLAVEKIILQRLIRWSAKTKLVGDEIILRSFDRMALLWFTLAGIYGALLSLRLRPEIMNVMEKILLVLFILSFTVIFGKIAVGFVGLYANRAREVLPSTTIFTNLTKLTIFIIGFLIILQTLGISIAPILATLGVGGLAVALALQDTLSNLFSGLQIILSRQFKPGDYIKLDSGEEGYVEDITWRNTTLRALPNNLHIIPNAKLAGAKITNFNLPEREISVYIQVGVSYDSDLEQVERVTKEVGRSVLREIEGGVPHFDPVIRFHTFADFSINLTVVLRATEFVNQYLLKHEFIKRLHKRYREEGIEIPFPIRTVYMKKTDQQ